MKMKLKFLCDFAYTYLQSEYFLESHFYTIAPEYILKLKMIPSAVYLLECYTGGKLIEEPEDLERSGESEEHVTWPIYPAQMAESMISIIENPEINIRNGPLNFRLRQSIRDLAWKLKSTADSLHVRPGSALLSVERAILVNEGLNHDEMQVVSSILSERTPTTVSRVAEHLGKYMTSRTFRAAVRYLCYSASSAPEELAVVCELVKLTYPTIRQLSWADSVYEVINEFIEDRLNDVLH